MKAVRKLTNMGTDVRQIAKLLQKKAPPGHKLAYINEEEAAILKARGGSGRITPEGIPSYEDTYYSDPTSAQSMQPVASAPEPAQTLQGAATPLETATPAASDSSLYGLSSGVSANPPASSDSLRLPDYNQTLAIPQPGQAPALGALPSPSFQANAPYISPQYDFTALKAATDVGAAAVAPGTTADKTSYTDKLTEYLSKPDFAVRGASGLAQALIAANQANKARQSAQQAKTETQALATPYQQQGQQLQQAAQRGELNPQGQQAIQAAQAQAAQSVATRGGVGGLQATQQIENMRQSLLQNQMNLGLQLQQVGDKIAQGAIQAGVQADQYINTLTANYAANIARTVAGTPSTTTTTTTGVA